MATYDIKCYQLAELFLAEKIPDKVVATPRDMDLLAQRIQQAIEDYIKFELEDEPAQEEKA